MTIDLTTLIPTESTIIAVPLLLGLAIAILKGFSLYKSARLKEQVWFWFLLFLNPLGILSAIYLFIRRNKKVN